MNAQPNTGGPAVSYNRTVPALVVNNLTIDDPSVVSESRRWSSGIRGPAVSEDTCAGVDFSTFITQAVTVGARAIAAAGGVQDTFNLERLVSDVGARTSQSTEDAAQATTEVVSRAVDAVEKASLNAKEAIAAAGKNAQQQFGEAVSVATKSLVGEMNRLVGGDNPELAGQLAPLLEKFGRDLDARVSSQTSDLFTKAAKQFDPDDPTSPMSKHTRDLDRRQQTLAEALEKNHKELAAKVEELATAVKVSASANIAATATAKATPLKGATYASELHPLVDQVAVGLGDEYTDTGSTSGLLSNANKKGDGVLAIAGGARVVLEMTDSKRAAWNDYLDEAERNRGAVASLGLVRTVAQNNGNVVRALGPRRIVLAFDPQNDEPDLLRTVIQLLRISALAANSRNDAEGIRTADEKIAEAITLLNRIDEIKKVTGTIRQSAIKVESTSDEVRTALARVLGHAQSALSLAATNSVVDAA